MIWARAAIELTPGHIDREHRSGGGHRPPHEIALERDGDWRAHGGVRARNLLRPQFSGFDELWAVSGSGRDQQISVHTADEEIEVSAKKVLGKGEVTAFRISPDGARIALIRKSGDRSQLGIARIRRAADKITVDGGGPSTPLRPISRTYSICRTWPGSTPRTCWSSVPRLLQWRRSPSR